MGNATNSIKFQVSTKFQVWANGVNQEHGRNPGNLRPIYYRKHSFQTLSEPLPIKMHTPT